MEIGIIEKNFVLLPANDDLMTAERGGAAQAGQDLQHAAAEAAQQPWRGHPGPEEDQVSRKYPVLPQNNNWPGDHTTTFVSS